MMALKPTQENSNKGLFNMLYNTWNSIGDSLELNFPENIPHLNLQRIYRCTENIRMFFEVIVKNLNNKYAIYSETINSNSISFKSGHEIYGATPEILFIPKCNCFGNCKTPREHIFISHKTKIFAILNRISSTLKSRNLVVILTVGPETQKCVDWLNEELSRKSTLNNVDVKTIEQSRGLEFPALLTISNEGKIASELSEAHITGDFFSFTVKKLGFEYCCSELGSVNFLRASPIRRYCTSIPQTDDSIDRYILPRTTAFPQYLHNLPDFSFIYKAMIIQLYFVFRCLDKSNIFTLHMSYGVQVWPPNGRTERCLEK